MSEEKKTTRRSLLSAAPVAGAAAVLSSTASSAHEVEINAMGPTPEQLQEFMALPDGPIVMVNLLKFKPDGGREEYAKYGAAIQPILKKIGARMLFSGDAKVCLIGQGDWDAVGLVEYPNKMALIQMSQSAEYQAIHPHRAAGLDGQVNYAVVQNRDLAG